ncbi:ras guanine nucleotide exchange factor domain-containing protein [Gorgonomyces haynaldii]|nr:ras guanine nucleotide exchange factor domain-containing protein [Gorgonomyces haynaldii]
METVPPVFLEHHGPVKAQLTLTGPSAHYFHLKSSAIYIYASQEDMDKGKLIKEVKLENCVAIPSAQPTDFDIEFQDYTIACSVSSLRSKLTWVSMINSASLELSVHHAEHLKVLDQDVQQQLFNLEYEHLLETIKEFTGTEEPPKQKIVPAPEFPRSRGRQRSVYNGITCVNYNVGSDGIRQIFNINSITLQKWVERLTDQHGPDPDFAAFAIHCYRHICDPEQLMELLIERMHVDVPQTDYLYKWRSIIKLRVISFVCLWLRLAWSPDFVAPQNRQLLDKFLSCVPWPESIKPEPYEKLIVKTFARLGDHIHAIITKMERSYAARTLLADEKHDKAQYNMLTVDPHMIAFELTQKDHANLQAIKPLQLLVRLWQKESDPIIAQEIQPITDLINSINTTSFWVATEICTQPEIKNRVKMVEQFIKIAKECRKLNNFNSTMAIVSGLNLVSVSRLKSTWEQVDPKRGKQLAELESFLSPAGNYKNYRQQLSELDALEFKIPILSLFVKDLFFTNDGNPQYTDKVDEKSLKLINLDKLIGLYKKASSFCLEQRRSPPAKPPGDYQEANNAVHNMRALKEQPLYKYSLLCEPKQGDNETLRLREKWMQQ